MAGASRAKEFRHPTDALGRLKGKIAEADEALRFLTRGKTKEEKRKMKGADNAWTHLTRFLGQIEDAMRMMPEPEGSNFDHLIQSAGFSFALSELQIIAASQENLKELPIVREIMDELVAINHANMRNAALNALWTVDRPLGVFGLDDGTTRAMAELGIPVP